MTPRIIYLAKRAEIEITSRMGNALETSGLTPIQYTLLYFIDINKGDLSSAQLSRRFSVTPQSMNELVQVLQKKNLVRKNADPAHGRILRIGLTKKGKQLLEDSNHVLDELEKNLFIQLSHNERTILRTLLAKILGGVAAQHDKEE
jgi:DNA-binding MarR family transcriptional regulator